MRMLIPSILFALFDGIFFRSASMISLVMGGMQNSTLSFIPRENELFIRCIDKVTFSKRASRSDFVVTGPSGGSDVTFNEVTYSVKASAIFAGSFMCSSLTLIAIGALEGGLCML